MENPSLNRHPSCMQKSADEQCQPLPIEQNLQDCWGF